MTKTRRAKFPRPKIGICVAALALALSGCKGPAPLDPLTVEALAAARPEARREVRWLMEGWLEYQRHEAAMGAGSSQQISPTTRK